MDIIDLIQGTDAWHAHRADHHNGSDAPAMFGVSKYETRDSLLQRTQSGRAREFSQFVQERVIDSGHVAEASARALAEKIIGKSLFPVTAKNGKYSASFDGLTMNEKTSWEHKSMNDELREFFAAGGEGKDLPIMYRVQMEHQFIVSESEKCLFMASKWDSEGELIEEEHVWYYPDLALRKEIISRWDQFERDLQSFAPVLIPEKVIVEDIKPLPTITAKITAQVLETNVDEVFKAHQKFIADIKPATDLETDEDFAYGDKLVKFSTDFEEYCQKAEDNALSQAASVNDFIITVRTMREGTRGIRLAYKKALDAKKEAVKNNAILTAKNDYAEFVTGLNVDCIVNLRSYLQAPDFAAAIKNVRTMTGLHQRINDALASGKATADSFAKEVKAKISHIQTAIVGYEHLFNVADLAVKELELIDLHIQTKKQDEDNRRAELAAQVAQEAEANARQMIEQENAAKVQQEQSQLLVEPQAASNDELQPANAAPTVSKPSKWASGGSGGGSNSAISSVKKSNRPTRDDMIAKVAFAYNISRAEAEIWLIDEFQVAKAA